MWGVGGIVTPRVIVCLYLLASQMVDLDKFVEMTKNYAQGIAPAAPNNGGQVSAKNETPASRDGPGEVKRSAYEHSRLIVRVSVL